MMLRLSCSWLDLQSLLRLRPTTVTCQTTATALCNAIQIQTTHKIQLQIQVQMQSPVRALPLNSALQYKYKLNTIRNKNEK